MTKPVLTDRRRLIEERLEFVDLISGLHKHFHDSSLVRDTSEGGWTHPWLYFDSLRNYLLLTCFDLLGQRGDYKDFGTWLRADSVAAERDEAVRSLNLSAPIIQNVAQLFDSYLERYGNKRSFDRFIDEVLPPKERDELFASIWIREIDPKANREVGVLENVSLKRRFLYELRNSYTHSATNTGSAAGGLFHDSGTPIDMEGELRYGYEIVRWEVKNGVRTEYSVRRWPHLLKDLVRIGLDQVELKASAT
jgi:hypothetical protein